MLPPLSKDDKENIIIHISSLLYKWFQLAYKNFGTIKLDVAFLT